MVRVQETAARLAQAAAKRPVRVMGASVTALTLVAGLLVATARPEHDPVLPAAGAANPVTTATTAPPATTTTPTTVSPTTVSPTTTAAPTTAPPPADPAAAAATVAATGAWSLDPYRGLGAWVDVYDWTHEFTKGSPTVGPEHMAEMSRLGIQTVFIQTSHYNSAADVIEADRLRAMIDDAHAHGLSVVGWYLPTLEDLDLDLRRLLAGAAMGVDGLGVDIESRRVADHAERNRRLLDLSSRLRHAVGGRAVTAITPSAVHLQVVNPGWWPAFPWAEIANTYDAILPMAYWTIRSGEYRNAERYIAENIDRIRASTGRSDVAIHPIGGIADRATVEDLNGFIRAAGPRGVLGGSLYDFDTSDGPHWAALAPFRQTRR